MTPAAIRLLEQLQAAFPQRVVLGVITPHECDECSAIRVQLEGRTWGEISTEFAEEFSGSLPLLSPDAYNAYLPIWLRASLANPDGESAAMIAVNLSSQPSHAFFNDAQAAVLIAVVEYVAHNNCWGIDDPTNSEAIKNVKAEWARSAA